MSSNKTIAGLNSGSVPCSDSSDSILLLWRSPESSLRRKLRSISSRSESCPGDRELLPRFGQLFSLPELFGRLQNADGIRPRGLHQNLLRQRQQALSTELQAIAHQTKDRAAFLRL